MSIEELKHMLEVEMKNREQLVAAFNNQMGRLDGRIELLKSLIAAQEMADKAEQTPVIEP